MELVIIAIVIVAVSLIWSAWKIHHDLVGIHKVLSGIKDRMPSSPTSTAD